MTASARAFLLLKDSEKPWVLGERSGLSVLSLLLNQIYCDSDRDRDRDRDCDRDGDRDCANNICADVVLICLYGEKLWIRC